MHTVTDKDLIEEVLSNFVRQPHQQRVAFIPQIRVAPGADWNGWEVTQGGLVIEGARPMGMATYFDTGEKMFSLTNSDSGYSKFIGAVKLSDIVSVSLLH